MVDRTPPIQQEVHHIGTPPPSQVHAAATGRNGSPRLHGTEKSRKVPGVAIPAGLWSAHEDAASA